MTEAGKFTEKSRSHSNHNTQYLNTLIKAWWEYTSIVEHMNGSNGFSVWMVRHCKEAKHKRDFRRLASRKNWLIRGSQKCANAWHCGNHCYLSPCLHHPSHCHTVTTVVTVTTVITVNTVNTGITPRSSLHRHHSTLITSLSSLHCHHFTVVTSLWSLHLSSTHCHHLTVITPLSSLHCHSTVITLLSSHHCHSTVITPCHHSTITTVIIPLSSLHGITPCYHSTVITPLSLLAVTTVATPLSPLHCQRATATTPVTTPLSSQSSLSYCHHTGHHRRVGGCVGRCGVANQNRKKNVSITWDTLLLSALLRHFTFLFRGFRLQKSSNT
jgi:hypothetical protein